MVLKRKAMKGSEGRKKSVGSMFLWGLLILALKVLGIALLVQGFVMQLSTGLLYYGMLHYALGSIAMIAAWHLHGKKCEMCGMKHE